MSPIPTTTTSTIANITTSNYHHHVDVSTMLWANLSASHHALSGSGSTLTPTTTTPRPLGSPLITDAQMDQVHIYMSMVLRGLISLVGIASNVINMAVFRRMGVKDSMSVCLMTLSVTDFLVTLLGLAGTLCFVMDVYHPYGLIDPLAVHYVFIGWNRDIVYVISGWITTFLSVERCVCVVFPFRVKQIFTRGRSVVAMATIYLVVLAVHAPVIATQWLVWKRVQISSGVSGSGADAGYDAGYAPPLNMSSGRHGSYYNQTSQNPNLLSTSTSIFDSSASSATGVNGATGGVMGAIGVMGVTAASVSRGDDGGASAAGAGADVGDGAGGSGGGGGGSSGGSGGGPRFVEQLVLAFADNRHDVNIYIDIANGAVLPIPSQVIVFVSVFLMIYGLRASSRIRTNHLSAARVGASASASTPAPAMGFVGGGGGGGDSMTSSADGKKKTKKEKKTTGESKKDDSKAGESKLSSKEGRLVKVVLSLAIILSVCNVPRFLAVYTKQVFPEVNFGRRYANLYTFLWNLAAIMAIANSTVNILVYLAINVSYRNRLRELLRLHKKTVGGDSS